MAKGQKTGGRVAGTPNKATADVKALAGVYGPAAIERAAELAGLVEGKPKAESETAQMAALNTILDRAYGKAAQALRLGGDDDAPPIQQVLRWANSTSEATPDPSKS